MRERPIPNTFKKFKIFLGLTRYYHKFFNNYGKIETTLTKLLKKEAFSWTKETTNFFEVLKEAMCKTLILVTLTPQK